MIRGESHLESRRRLISLDQLMVVINDIKQLWLILDSLTSLVVMALFIEHLNIDALPDGVDSV